MVRIALSSILYIGSLVAILASAGLIAQVLAAYPADHLDSFGPIVPAISKTHASWLPSAPRLLALAGGLSALACLYFWRANRPIDTKTYAVGLFAAFNYFLALFCVTTLLVAYFYLPQVANAA